jgi:hypothetical protein
VEVLHRQQFGEALLDPALPCQPLALGTVAVAAGAIDDARVLAVVAPFDGATQCGGTAVLDGLHEAMLMQGQGMRLPVGGAVLSKDVGQLGSRPGHAYCAGAGTAVVGSDLALGPAAEFFTGLQVIQGALGAGDELLRDSRVVRGGIDALMTEQAWMTRISVPFSSRCVAKLCRSVWTVMRLRRPACWAASWQASCKEAGVRWRLTRQPGNSHSVGRAGGPPPGAQDLQRGRQPLRRDSRLLM